MTISTTRTMGSAVNTIDPSALESLEASSCTCPK
jgi:hypothetical protein